MSCGPSRPPPPSLLSSLLLLLPPFGILFFFTYFHRVIFKGDSCVILSCCIFIPLSVSLLNKKKKINSFKDAPSLRRPTYRRPLAMLHKSASLFAVGSVSSASTIEIVILTFFHYFVPFLSSFFEGGFSFF